MSKQEITQSGSVSPAEVISKALSDGADLEQLEKLLELQMKWEANEAKKAFNKSMSSFKENPPEINKDKSVGFSTAKGRTSYSHASLHNVVTKVTSALSKHGLSASWRTQQNGKIVVTCKITHILGHSEETSLSADADDSGSKNSIQAMGSTITYLERYSLLAILGLATHDQDQDGNTASTENIKEDQIKNIKKQLVELGSKEDVLLKYMKIEKLEDMLLSDYPKAQVSLQARRDAIRKKDKK